MNTFVRNVIVSFFEGIVLYITGLTATDIDFGNKSALIGLAAGAVMAGISAVFNAYKLLPSKEEPEE